MESEFNVEVTASVDFNSDEMNLLRKSAAQDYVEPRFKKIPEEITMEDLQFLREAVGLTIEWGDYPEEDHTAASKLYGDLDSLLLDFEQTPL